jgi:alginate O-acetyltransferase complex protein AlgJ
MTDDIRQRYEDPHMRPTEIGRVWDRLAAWALLVTMAGLLLAVSAWRQVGEGHGSLVDEARTILGEIRTAPSARDANRAALAGIERFEGRLEEGSPVLKAALPTLQWAMLRYGGVGNETVYTGPRTAGEDGAGGLVLRTGFDHLVGPSFLDAAVLERRRRAQPSWQPPLEPDPRPALLDFHAQLRARGVELIFLPVPTKPAVHPELLGAEHQGPSPEEPLENPSLDDLLETLRQAGVHVLDPDPLLRELARSGERAYLRTDSHWSPKAVDLVAEALARKIESIVGLPPIPPADHPWIRTRLERRGRGDLWRLLELPPDRPLYREESLEVEEITAWDGRLWQPERSAEVLLLGDSFTTVYSDPALHWGSAAGLAEQLAYHLGRDVDRIARPDGSSDQVRRELARRPEGLGETKVVVYQVATRELSFGDWPIVELP